MGWYVELLVWTTVNESLTHHGSLMYLCHRREALSMWKSRLGRSATYRLLIDTFLRAGRVHLAEFVCELLGEIGSKSGTTQSHAVLGPL